MRVAILHHDLEHQEEYLNNFLINNGIDSELMDVRETSVEELSSFDFVFNRVFASVGNRDYLSNLKTLEYLEKLESLGVKCINSFLTTKCDYSKYFSYKLLSEKNIRTPKSFFVKIKEDLVNLNKFIEEVNFPVIIKRDLGGRALDIHKVDNSSELYSILEEKFKDNKEQYDAGYVVQEFVESTLPCDYRISVINGKFSFGMTRSLLVTKGQEKPWFASVTKGSKVNSLNNVPEEIIELAERSSFAIGALFNEVDILMSKDGPVVIENNPTPNFTSFSEISQTKKEISANKIVEVLKMRA